MRETRRWPKSHRMSPAGRRAFARSFPPPILVAVERRRPPSAQHFDAVGHHRARINTEDPYAEFGAGAADGARERHQPRIARRASNITKIQFFPTGADNVDDNAAAPLFHFFQIEPRQPDIAVDFKVPAGAPTGSSTWSMDPPGMAPALFTRISISGKDRATRSRAAINRRQCGEYRPRDVLRCVTGQPQQVSPSREPCAPRPIPFELPVTSAVGRLQPCQTLQEWRSSQCARRWYLLTQSNARRSCVFERNDDGVAATPRVGTLCTCTMT